MFWREHSYVAFSTTYIGYLTLRRKSAYLHRKKIMLADLYESWSFPEYFCDNMISFVSVFACSDTAHNLFSPQRQYL